MVNYVRLSDLVIRWQPFPRDYPETWLATARQQWTYELDHMKWLLEKMVDHDEWVFGPAELSKVTWTVGDAHHRISIALGLGWHHRFIPVIWVD